VYRRYALAIGVLTSLMGIPARATPQDVKPTCIADPNPRIGFDRLDLAHNDDGVRVTFLVSGKRGQTCTRQQQLDGRDVLSIENIEHDTDDCTAEIAMFAPGHRMQFIDRKTCFTDGPELITFDVSAPMIELPVTVWAVNADATHKAAIVALATQDALAANVIYSTSGCGLVMSVPTFKSGRLSSDLSADALRHEVGVDANRINVYYLPSGLDAKGLEIDGNVLILGPDASRDTLAHEFGHALSLDHIDDAFNIMSTNSFVRKDLTIGQCYIANLNKQAYTQVARFQAAPSTEKLCTGLRSSACPGARCTSCADHNVGDLLDTLSHARDLAPLTVETGAANLPQSATTVLERVLAEGPPASLRTVIATDSRTMYGRMVAYAQAHRGWTITESEDAFVRREVARYDTSLQLRSIKGLQQLLGKDAKATLDRARLKGTNLGTLRPDIGRAIDAAIRIQ
jgi:hypothetical protein